MPRPVKNPKPPTGSVDPRYDPEAILKFEYPNLVAGHFRQMRPDYRIVRSNGTHDWLLLMTLSGSGIIRHGRKQMVLRRNQLALFKPRMPHDYGTHTTAGHWTLIWVHFHPLHHWLPLFNWLEPLPGVLSLKLPDRSASTRQITHELHEVHRLANSTLPRRDWMAMNALESLLLTCENLSGNSRPAIDARLESALQHVERHLDEPIYLPTLARLVNLSVSHFSTLFRAELKISPQTYLERRRMDRASKLLQIASLSIKEIAAMTGFEDPLYFSKRFTRHWGHPPSAHREKTRRNFRPGKGFAK